MTDDQVLADQQMNKDQALGSSPLTETNAGKNKVMTFYKMLVKVSKGTLSDNVKLSDWDNPDLVWAKLRDDWPMWQDAIQKEIDQLEARGTWRDLESICF